MASVHVPCLPHGLDAHSSMSIAHLGETGPLSQGVQEGRQALRTRHHIHGMEVHRKRPRGVQVNPLNPVFVSPRCGPRAPPPAPLPALMFFASAAWPVLSYQDRIACDSVMSGHFTMLDSPRRRR